MSELEPIMSIVGWASYVEYIFKAFIDALAFFLDVSHLLLPCQVLNDSYICVCTDMGRWKYSSRHPRSEQDRRLRNTASHPLEFAISLHSTSPEGLHNLDFFIYFEFLLIC